MDGRNSLVATIGLSSYDVPNMDIDDFDNIAEQAAQKVIETSRLSARAAHTSALNKTQSSTYHAHEEDDGALASMWW